MKARTSINSTSSAKDPRARTVAVLSVALGFMAASAALIGLAFYSSGIVSALVVLLGGGVALIVSAGYEHMVHSNRLDTSFQIESLDSLSPLVDVQTRLSRLVTKEEAERWLNTPNDHFDGQRPLALIRDGKSDVVIDLLGRLDEGIPN